eukprot:5863518-Alexandrium_andersonii.AAC.1
MRRYYETVGLDDLFEKGIRLGVHPVLWCVEMSVYRGPRVFTLAGVVTSEVWARRGIPAGGIFFDVCARVHTVE